MKFKTFLKIFLILVVIVGNVLLVHELQDLLNEASTIKNVLAILSFPVLLYTDYLLLRRINFKK